MNLNAYNQIATYWPSPAPNGTGGYTFGTPKEIYCHWEERQELYVDEFGQEKNSQAAVYVLEDLDIQGYLLLGSSSVSDPTTLPSARKIQQFVKIPDLRGVQWERRVYL